MSRKILPIVVLTLAALAAGAALATPPSGLSSELLARGAGGTFRIHDKSMKLKIKAKEPTDVALVKAILGPGGFTGWHGHPGPSIVIVKSGELTMYEPRRGVCVARTFGPGKAFVHPEHAHNFVNTGAATAEFYVAYFIPAGAAPLLNDVTPAPAECS